MSSFAISLPWIAAAYLIGAIPFGYLLAKWWKGIDIRTVGSGNIGATNVGRVLGFRYFWPVFLLDLAKGLLPTLGFPILADRLSDGGQWPDLAVFVALATILGHNFPVYLHFRGGKGVATSLGAVFALDPVAGALAAVAFVTILLLSRYVSLSSIGGGIVFFLVHFASMADPWSRRKLSMSLLTIALLALLIGRHRKNLARIAAGTEPKVSLRRPKPPGSPPSGCLRIGWLLLLVTVSSGVLAAVVITTRSAHSDSLRTALFTMTEVDRESTGHQCADRVAFADDGRLLAVTCPRYCRLVLYRVSDGETLDPLHDLSLDGQPVALCVANDRLYLLLRPEGDNRHVQPGWIDTFDLNGRKLAAKTVVGYYPDDLALSADGRYAYVLTSGRAEGDASKPAPALAVYDLQKGSPPVGHVSFDGPRDDPSRITLSSTRLAAMVALDGSNEWAAIDLYDPVDPRVIGRAPLPEVEYPQTSQSGDDAILMPVASGRDAVPVSIAGAGGFVACALPHGSGVELFLAGKYIRSLGRLTLHGGAMGMSSCRPTGLAFCPQRSLLAVANRSGGVHLLAIRPARDSAATVPVPVAVQ